MQLMPATRRIRRATPRAIHRTRWVAFAGIGLLFLEVPALAHIPARLISGCGVWIALAAGLELMSVLGFIVIFKLVFGRRLTWRRGTVAALRGLGASAVLPAGGIVGPALGARATHGNGPSSRALTRSAVAFTMLTNTPGALVLALLGVTLWLGWPPGPHAVLLTLPPAAVAVALIAATWLLGRTVRHCGSYSVPGHGRSPWRVLTTSARLIRDGAADARSILLGGDWKLLGAVCYFAFDNAVLWAAFRAYGRVPSVSVVIMGYLVGSLSSAIPVPAGLGVLEGGLIGALVLYGAPAAPAAAAVLLYRGISLALPVALGAYSWVVEDLPPASSTIQHSMMLPSRWQKRRSTPPSDRSPGLSRARRSRGVA